MLGPSEQVCRLTVGHFGMMPSRYVFINSNNSGRLCKTGSIKVGAMFARTLRIGASRGQVHVVRCASCRMGCFERVLGYVWSGGCRIRRRVRG